MRLINLCFAYNIVIQRNITPCLYGLFLINCLTYYLILISPFQIIPYFEKYSSISLTGKTSSLFLAHTFHVLLHNFETSTAKNKDTKYKRRYKVFLVSTNRHEKHTFHSYHIVSCRFLVKFRILGNLNHDTLHFNMIVVQFWGKFLPYKC